MKLRGRDTTYKRNGKCPCKSGKKFKHCCITKVRQMQTAMDEGLNPQTILVNDILGPPKS